MSTTTTKQTISASQTEGKISVTTTCDMPNCSTVRVEECDKYQFMANLNNEKARNISEITRMTSRNVEIENLLTEINAL